MSDIPADPAAAAAETDVKDTSRINQIEFLKQIIENIKSQITSVDAEFLAASKENKEVCHDISRKSPTIKFKFKRLWRYND